jgi:signal transduction histidine kinase
VVALILAVMAIALFFMLRQSYYGAVGQLLQSEANIIAGVLNRYQDRFGVVDPNEIRRSIEEFENKNRMELMAINAYGEVMLTSSGFSPEIYEMPDFRAAQQDSGGFGQHIGFYGTSRNAEKYMAVTVMLPSQLAQQSTYSAIRLVASLEAVDNQIYSLTLLVGLASIGTLLLLLFLGLYFIRSIVSPLRQIGITAGRLAGGDFSVRIAQTNVDSGDEIGELSKVINHMADELENSESIKNEFISSVSHELRTPLTAIKGWGETVLEMQDSDTTEKGMKVIITEADRLTVMVEELLDFSRIQSGGFTLQTAEIDILEELSAAVVLYTERAKKEGIVLEYENRSGLFINGDKNRIRQVFLNIIDNAIKYSERDSVVSVKADEKDEEIIISVTDNGHGISRADLPKVKMKFFKANNTRRGSGIGLAVADEIVSLHDGKLNIKSQQGKGTTVRITLPLVAVKTQKKTEVLT